MNRISITEIITLPKPVCVVVDGYCNHADTTSESIDFGYADPVQCDYVDDWRDCAVCVKCGATYNEYDNSWILKKKYDKSIDDILGLKVEKDWEED